MTRIVIIGGGPAGYEAALVAAQHGADVTLVERDGIGGACVLSDCVPSKTFIASAGGAPPCASAGDARRSIGRRGQRRGRPAVVNGRVKGLALGPVRRHPGPRCSARACEIVRARRVLRRRPRARAHRSWPSPTDGTEESRRPTWC